MKVDKKYRIVEKSQKLEQKTTNIIMLKRKRNSCLLKNIGNRVLNHLSGILQELSHLKQKNRHKIL